MWQQSKAELSKGNVFLWTMTHFFSDLCHKNAHSDYLWAFFHTRYHTMKLTVTACLCSIFTSLSGQITIDNSYFPVAGDTLWISFDEAPEGIVVGPGGVNQIWDFSSLEEEFDRYTAIRPASEGTAFDIFPSAELVALYENGGEGYFNVTADVYEQIGYKGEDPAGIGIEVVTGFDGSLVERRAPMQFLDIHTFEGDVSLPIAGDQLPQELLDQIPVVPDSVRIRVHSERTDVVDAWGSLTIPAGTYPVLRERRIEHRDTRFDVLLFGNWLDFTDVVPFTEFLGLDTITTYNYFTNEIKEPLAVVTVETDGAISRVEYKDDQLVGTFDPGSADFDMQVYPNPAVNEVRFQLSDVPNGLYHLTIYSIIGAKVWEKSYRLSGNHTLYENVSRLKKGMYLFALSRADNGKVLKTKRLVIIRP